MGSSVGRERVWQQRPERLAQTGHYQWSLTLWKLWKTIRGNALNLVKNYLSETNAYIVIVGQNPGWSQSSQMWLHVKPLPEVLNLIPQILHAWIVHFIRIIPSTTIRCLLAVRWCTLALRHLDALDQQEEGNARPITPGVSQGSFCDHHQ